MNSSSTSPTPENRPRPVARFFFIIGTMGVFSGLLATSNALDFRHPMDPAIGMGEALVGGLLALIASGMLHAYSWLIKTLILECAILVALFGVVRVFRLAFGAPWSIFSSQALLPAALTVLGGVAVYLAYKFLRAGNDPAVF